MDYYELDSRRKHREITQGALGAITGITLWRWRTCRLLLLYLNNKISSDFKTLAQNFTSCEKKSSHLTAEISQVKQNNHDLQTKIKTLKEKIKTCEDQKENSGMFRFPYESRHSSCPKGWIHSQSSCYAVNDAVPRNQKTWEEAQEDCIRKGSDLTIVGNEEEKVKTDSETVYMNWFWIGLRDEGGKWKWMDGSDLTNQ
uniref:C-type lectin domain-containing protein n=1 Tax=Xiphophorus maculatus TaxID=8083 RepID=M4AFS7_XIPMA